MCDISQHDFAAARRLGDAQVIDVREVEEFISGHVPGAASIPMGQLMTRLSEVDRFRPVYLICATGRRSAVVTDVLTRQGFHAQSVSGGTRAWLAAGRAVDRGPAQPSQRDAGELASQQRAKP